MQYHVAVAKCWPVLMMEDVLYVEIHIAVRGVDYYFDYNNVVETVDGEA